jgi:hypothetical protein
LTGFVGPGDPARLFETGAVTPGDCVRAVESSFRYFSSRRSAYHSSMPCRCLTALVPRSTKRHMSIITSRAECVRSFRPDVVTA